MKFLKSLLLSALIIGAVWVVLALFAYLNTFALLVVLNAMCILIGAIIIYQGGV